MTLDRAGLKPAHELSDEEIGQVLASALAWLHARAQELERAGQVPEPEADGQPSEGKERKP